MRVKNRKIIRTLTLRSLKAGKLRNIVALIAIALTAILFTTVFTIGGNMLVSMQNATMRQVGTSSHGGLKYLTQEQYENFQQSPLIENISYSIVIGFAENEELQKKQTEIRYGEDDFARWGFSYPVVGTMPKERMDLACSTITLDMLGLPHELGQKVALEFTVHGKKYVEEFTLCGFWPGDDVMQATQVWLSREYADSILGVPAEPVNDPSDMAGTISADVWFASPFDVEGKIEALIAERGYAPGEIRYGVNWAYAGSDIDIFSVLVVAVVIALILLSGYLIIYSVFTISVTGDIRFYGLLKTIGATGRQLRRIVRGQALCLSFIGIPIGLILGYLLGHGLTPFLMSMTTMDGDFSTSANPLIFVFAAAFSLVTVFISCRKPGRIAARVSPVEAVRYAEAPPEAGKRKVKRTGKVSPFSMAWSNVRRNPKKLAVVVLSLSLSLILLNSAYAIVQGFDMEKYLQNQIVSDFSAADHSVYSAMIHEDNYEGVDSGFLSGVSKLPGLEDMANIYFYDDIFHTLSESGHQNMMETLDILTPYIEKTWPRAMEDAESSAITPLHVYGVGEMAANLLAEDGTLDFEKLQSGNYALVTRFFPNYEEEVSPIYNVGDMVSLVNEAGEIREFEVLAVVPEFPYPISCQHGHIIDNEIILADNAYLDFYGDRQPMMTVFNVADGQAAAAEKWLSEYCEQENPDMDYRSHDYYKDEFEGMKNTYMVLGGAMSFILALIGILNFLNAIVTSIFARRRELAMLQSVGMTGRQLKTMLFGEGLCYAALTVLFTVTIGTLIGYFIIQALAGQIWFFQWAFTLTPVLCSIFPLVLVCALVPLACYRFMRKESLVERLRKE